MTSLGQNEFRHSLYDQFYLQKLHGNAELILPDHRVCQRVAFTDLKYEI